MGLSLSAPLHELSYQAGQSLVWAPKAWQITGLQLPPFLLRGVCSDPFWHIRRRIPNSFFPEAQSACIAPSAAAPSSCFRHLVKVFLSLATHFASLTLGELTVCWKGIGKRKYKITQETMGGIWKHLLGGNDGDQVRGGVRLGWAGLVGNRGPALPVPSPLCVARRVCGSCWQLLHLMKAPAEASLLGPGAPESLGQVGSHLDSG